jgi:hypothetical protein
MLQTLDLKYEIPDHILTYRHWNYLYEFQVRILQKMELNIRNSSPCIGTCYSQWPRFNIGAFEFGSRYVYLSLRWTVRPILNTHHMPKHVKMNTNPLQYYKCKKSMYSSFEHIYFLFVILNLLLASKFINCICKSTLVPIIAAAQSKEWNIFARSNTGIMGSNPTRGMDVGVRLFCICVVLCVGSGLATGWSPVQEVLPTVYSIKKPKKGPRSTRTVEP